MSEENGNGTREHWGSGLGFVLAAAGSAIGLGNIWKFPYITGENGGGAFVLVYLLCIAVIGLPVMLCEITIGRKTQRNPVGAFKALGPDRSVVAQVIGSCLVLLGIFLLPFGRFSSGVLLIAVGGLVFRFGWISVGAMGVLAGFTILSFYSVVAGWTIGYIIKGLFGGLAFGNVPPDQAVAMAEDAFGTFVGSGTYVILCHLIFMVLCALIVIKGIQGGIERWSKILMPLLFLLLLILIVRGITLPGASEGIRFYLSPDFSKLSGDGVLEALGHAFFSLSLGMGAMITYGSYVRREENLFKASLSIVILDTLVALMAGLAIFPAVFAMGFEPGAGPGLVFQVLPAVFANIPGGAFWAVLFFLLLTVAALTSGISLLEVVTAYLVDEKQWSRAQATLVCAAVIFCLGCACALHGPVFDLMDTASSNYMLPLGGLFIALFIGWIWGTGKAIEEIRHGSSSFADVHLVSLLAGLKDDPSHNSDIHALTLASVWGVFIRFVTPVAVLICFLNKVGWLTLD